MKKVFAIISLLLVAAMALSFSACGNDAPAASTDSAVGSGQLTETPGETIVDVSKLEPAANVNPATLNIGQSFNGVHSGDEWYANGVRGDNYIYFEAADNSTVGYAYVKVEAGEIVKTVVCAMTDDNHLVDAEAAEGESGIDLVFVDEFKAYDYKNDTWYVRGDPAVISQLFVGRQLAEQSNPTNTLILNADGTGVEKFNDTEFALTWSMTGATTLKFNDGSYDFALEIVVDENNAFVSLSEQNLRIFIPEELVGQVNDAQSGEDSPQNVVQG